MKSDNSIHTMSSIPIRSIIRHIHRIQVSVMLDPDHYDWARKMAERHFNCSFKPKRVYGWKMVYHGVLEGSLMQISYRGRRRHRWMEVSIENPTEDAQSKLKSFINMLPVVNIDGIKKAYLSQVEFAVDIFPEDPRDVNRLLMDIPFRMIRRYSRDNSFNIVRNKLSVFRDGKKITWTTRPTYYFGTKGHVRKGPYGIRVYTRPLNRVPIFLRIELQANRELLRQEGIDINSLPLFGYELDFIDFVEFREGGTIDTARDLAERCIRKRRERRPIVSSKNSRATAKRKAMEAALRQAIRSLIANEMFSLPYEGNMRFFPEFVPVAHQICAYKRMAKEMIESKSKRATKRKTKGHSMSVKIEKAFPRIWP